MSLFDETGRLVRAVVRDKLYPAGPQQIPLSLTGVSPGLYFVRLQSNEGTRNEKLVVNR